MTTEENSEDRLKAAARAVVVALALKGDMITARQTYRQAICPRCEGDLRIALIGPKLHARIFCRDCQLSAME